MPYNSVLGALSIFSFFFLFFYRFVRFQPLANCSRKSTETSLISLFFSNPPTLSGVPYKKSKINYGETSITPKLFSVHFEKKKNKNKIKVFLFCSAIIASNELSLALSTACGKGSRHQHPSFFYIYIFFVSIYLLAQHIGYLCKCLGYF